MSTCGGFPIRTHVNVPGYGGSLRLYLSATKGGRTYHLESGVDHQISWHIALEQLRKPREKNITV